MDNVHNIYSFIVDSLNNGALTLIKLAFKYLHSPKSTKVAVHYH